MTCEARFSLVDVKPVAGHRSRGREKTNRVLVWGAFPHMNPSKNSPSKQRQQRHNWIGSEIRIGGEGAITVQEAAGMSLDIFH